MSKFSPARRFQMERLEDRQLMAADITASLQSDGKLVITEAAGQAGTPQAVQIAHLSNGKVRVTGIASPANPAGSKVNGAAFVEFAQPFKVEVKLGGGADTVQYVGAAHVDGLIHVHSILIDVADPAGSALDRDVVNVVNFNTGVNFFDVITGAGQDLVTVRNSSFGHLTINAGAGSDLVEIGSPSGGVAPVSVFGDINIFADAFTDADAAQGDDIVRMKDLSVGRDVIVNLRGGADTLDMTNVLARRHMSLHGEKGDDTMNLTQVTVWESLFALMGDDSDTLNLFGVKARNLTANGGSGFDRLVKYNDPGHETESLTGWEDINGKSLVIFRDLPPINGVFSLAK